MTPQAARFLEKAQKLLAEADIMIKVNLADAAGRNAYLSGFHAAQAFIFERIGKSPKTHTGVQAEFLRLTKDDLDIGSLRGFLSRAYNLKALADYETGPGSEISLERATQAVADGKSFIAYLKSRLEVERPR